MAAWVLRRGTGNRGEMGSQRKGSGQGLGIWGHAKQERRGTGGRGKRQRVSLPWVGVEHTTVV